MKNLVLGCTIALTASQVAGCIITTGEDDYATVGATWQIRTTAGSVASCPPGFDTAALFNQAVDSQGNPIGSCTGPSSISGTCFVDLFNCDANSGISAPLPPTRYLTWLAITDHNGINTYAQSLSAYLDVRAIDLDFHAQILTDGGYFNLTWDLVGEDTNAPLSCSQASANNVGLIATVSGGSTAFDTGWPCEDGYGVTGGIPQGSYTVVVDAHVAAGSVGQAPDLPNKVIQGPNRVTPLGHVTIPIFGL
jgi:hypothetical protein